MARLLTGSTNVKGKVFETEEGAQAKANAAASTAEANAKTYTDGAVDPVERTTVKLQREVAYLNMITAANNRIVDGFTFGTTFDENFNMDVDYTRSETTAALAVGAKQIPLVSAAGFKVGQEITVYDDVNLERVKIVSISGNTLTVAAMTKAYKNKAGVARSMIKPDPNATGAYMYGWEGNIISDYRFMKDGELQQPMSKTTTLQNSGYSTDAVEKKAGYYRVYLRLNGYNDSVAFQTNNLVDMSKIKTLFFDMMAISNGALMKYGISKIKGPVWEASFSNVFTKSTSLSTTNLRRTLSLDVSDVNTMEYITVAGAYGGANTIESWVYGIWGEDYAGNLFEIPLLPTNDLRFTVRDSRELAFWVEHNGLKGMDAFVNGQIMDKAIMHNEYQFVKGLQTKEPLDVRVTLQDTAINSTESKKATRILGGVS
ncbi:hypothetical protein FZD47_02530 [Bacillus infantis]|uniref:Uncharacterized protein n=1 Tax=Bacillus infantis TaxID=324767 RepID=A0A5D4SVY8_9BACI|nr:hypothetical protein [Bacillus infantis]TYS66382.1 hypothetical protein FZD47_02530 [Bacillus infantis]